MKSPVIESHPTTSQDPKAKAPGRQPAAARTPKFLGDDDVISAYLAEIKAFKTLTMAEERVLSLRIQKGDKAALNQLVQANLKFVVAVCRNYRSQGLPMGDLINEGNLGLMRAAQRFDPGMNYKFISYAVWWIRQGILTALAEQSRVLRIAPGKVTVFQKIGRASRALEQKLGRQPTSSELAEELGMSDMELSECLQLASHPVSLSGTGPDDEEGGGLGDALEDRTSDRPDKGARDGMLKERLATLLTTLDEREAEILRLYYGIGRPATLTLEEIAGRIGLTRERVRQIKSKALDRLRHPSRADSLGAFRE